MNNRNVETVRPEKLHKFMYRTLREWHVNDYDARATAAGLTDTSLRGIDTHGLRLFPHYVAELEAGRINPAPDFDPVRDASEPQAFRPEERGAFEITDARNRLGHGAGKFAMRRAVGLAKTYGVGVVAVQNSNHFGAAGLYALYAAAHDCIGLAMTHGNTHMLTPGSTRPFFGTNPVAFAAPMAGEAPFCYDAATTHMTWNRLLTMLEDDYRQIPDGWTEPPVTAGMAANFEHYVDRVFLTPAGGYKGFGLAMTVEILCSLLTGAAYGPNLPRMYEGGGEPRALGHVFAAVDIGRIVPVVVFRARLTAMAEDVRALPVRGPKDVVQVPGDPEKAAYAERKKNGIPVDAVLSDQLRVLGFKL